MQTVDALLEVLARGTEADVASLIYDHEELSSDETEIPTRLLMSIRPPAGDGSFRIVERHVEGAFELLILDLPWKREAAAPGSGYHPLLISREPNPRIVGFVLPWNELMSRLPPDAGSLGTLSAEWIIWTMSVQKSH